MIEHGQIWTIRSGESDEAYSVVISDVTDRWVKFVWTDGESDMCSREKFLKTFRLVAE